MSFKTLRALHALMGSAIDDMERIYAAAPEGPLDYPSLDTPFYKNAPPEDPKRVAAEKLTTNKDVFAASATVVSAAGQILATVNKPWFTMTEGVYSMHITACMHYVENANVVEILRDAGEGGLHVEEIARQIDAIREGRMKGKTDVRGLGHILRLLATYHWIKEVRPDVFANNRLSSYIDTGKSLESLRTSPETKYDGTNGISAFCTSTDDIFKCATRLPEWMLSGGHGFAGADARAPTTFNLFHDTKLGWYEWLEEPQNRNWNLQRFGHAMNGTRAWEELESMLDGFPWHTLRKDAVVADLGGGIGSVSMMLARAFPELRLVVQDRPNVVAMAPASWGPAYQEMFDAGRVTYQAQDFFEPQRPIEIKGLGTVPHADVYILRAVIHNWTDPDVERMLTALRKNAAPESRLLIVDIVPAYACVDDTPAEEGVPVERSLAPAGSPLLANLGKANVTGYLLDISMLTMFDARERTFRELSTLCLGVGWKLTSVYRATGSLWAYMIAEPV